MEMINAIGRRKASVARVYLTSGDGKITINGKPYKEYFPQTHIQHNITDPFTTIEAENIYDERRNRLLPSNVKKILFLMKNSVFM